MPGPVVEQLKDTGIIVAPVGGGSVQELIVARKEKGRMVSRNICDVRFVRLIGKGGFEENNNLS